MNGLVRSIPLLNTAAVLFHVTCAGTWNGKASGPMSEPPAPFEKLQVPLTSSVVELPEAGPPGHGDPTVSGLPEEGVNVKHVPPSRSWRKAPETRK